MLASLRRNSERRTTPFGPDASRGDHVECELCGDVGQCLDQFGLVACRSCRGTLLPKPTLL